MASRACARRATSFGLPGVTTSHGAPCGHGGRDHLLVGVLPLPQRRPLRRRRGLRRRLGRDRGAALRALRTRNGPATASQLGLRGRRQPARDASSSVADGLPARDEHARARSAQRLPARAAAAARGRVRATGVELARHAFAAVGPARRSAALRGCGPGAAGIAWARGSCCTTGDRGGCAGAAALAHRPAGPGGRRTGGSRARP